MGDYMIDVYNKITSDRLYEWIQSLEEKEELSDITLCAIKRIPMEAISSWYSILPYISESFVDNYLKYKGYGIKIANLFECFIRCSDWKTRKKMIKGYSEDHIEIGSISIEKDGHIIGEIGEKSDIIWSVYYNSFIQQDEEGNVQRTLSDEDTILSIQVWNNDGDDEKDIDETIKSYLLDISMQTEMKFEILYPDEMWKEMGENGHFSIETKTQYDSVSASYINYGMNCPDSRVAYLHLYEGIEYFFYKAEAAYYRDLFASHNMLQIDNTELINMIREISYKQKETFLLKLVLEKAIDMQKIRQYVNSNSVIIDTLKKDYGKGTAVVKDDLVDSVYIEHLTTRIYLFRCAIAHAKGDFDGYIAIPDVSNEEIEAEIPLMRYVAYEVIKCWS